MPGTPAISLKQAAKLTAKKHREAQRLFLAEGEALIRESTEPPRRLFDEPGEVRRLSTLTAPTGPIGVFTFLDVSAGELLSTTGCIVLLHGVQDPGNVGTIVRSAHAFGAGVALSRGCADLYNPKTVRATMGSIFHASVSRELEVFDFLTLSRSSGFATAAAVPQGGERPGSLRSEKLVVVVGAEGSGLSEDVVSACSWRVTIPALAPSLNAAVAASILLYEAYMRVLP